MALIGRLGNIIGSSRLYNDLHARERLGNDSLELASGFFVEVNMAVEKKIQRNKRLTVVFVIVGLVAVVCSGLCIVPILLEAAAEYAEARRIAQEAPTLQAKFHYERRGNDQAEMAYVPEGNFWMGGRIPDSRSRAKSALVRSVYVGAFWIDVYEVTQQLYKKCMHAGACSEPFTEYLQNEEHFGLPPHDEKPARVGLKAAAAYCRWVGKRLPSEKEWEKAARGTDRRNYPWGDDWDETRANALSTGEGPGRFVKIKQGGAFPAGASPYGVMDMAGNVREFVDTDGITRPVGYGEIQGITRGGGYSDSYWNIGTAQRDWSPLAGFRCVQ